MNFTVKLGKFAVKIHHRYDFIKEISREHITDTEPIFSVSVTEEQILKEQAQNGGRFSLELCESTCIHREVVKALVPYGLFLMHSAVIALDGTAYVFMAKSGVGKSTHIKLWKDAFGERAQVINGDKPMFSFEEDRLYVHGSPWRGKERMGAAVSAPVGGICFLERGIENVITPASEIDIVKKIFHQVLLPSDPYELGLFMKFINRLAAEVPFYNLKCNMNIDAALVAYRGMTGEKHEN